MTSFALLFRAISVGERLGSGRAVGSESVAACALSALRIGCDSVPAPQAERTLHSVAHRERQTATGSPHYRTSSHHRVGFPESHTLTGSLTGP